jgi:hypothetical protein
MRILLRVLLGLVLALASLVVCLYLGLLMTERGPDWRTGVLAVVLLVTTQLGSFFIFRHRIALRVLMGCLLCAAITLCAFCLNPSLPWEPQYPDGSRPITWRSGLLFVVLFAVTQSIAFWVRQLTKPRPRTREL